MFAPVTGLMEVQEQSEDIKRDTFAAIDSALDETIGNKMLPFQLAEIKAKMVMFLRILNFNFS